MKVIYVRILRSLAAVFIALFGLGSVSAMAQSPFKIGYIYVGPVDDYGYNFAQNEGRLYVEKHVPGVTTTFVENVPENADVDRVMQRMIQDGYKMIFATSYGYYGNAKKLAATNPGTIFEHSGGPDAVDPNLGTYWSEVYRAVYLSGVVAGKMTKTGKLGFVAAHPIPQVLANINAFALGAQSVHPGAKVYVLFTGSWANPAQESAAAHQLVSTGVDVLTDHQDNPIPVARVAEESKAYFVGYEANASKFAPTMWLTGAMFNWGPMEVDIVKSAMSGSYKPKALLGTFQDGAVQLAPYGPAVPAATKTLIAGLKVKYSKSDAEVFTGPIYHQSGKLLVAKGEKMKPEMINGMNFFVKDVVGTLK
jgi:basic membrane lipoprotein Med (substrate-binding protein (PBP1-ABC) superfamily)